jgi:hypothetical protein
MGRRQPRALPHLRPPTWGANAIYDIVDGKLAFRSYHKLPAPRASRRTASPTTAPSCPCPAAISSSQAWYQGGLSVIDFTDSAKPVEIAYFDRGPVHKDALVLGGFWSTYWYGGKIYGTEIARGLDVLALQPSEHLSANEIAAAALADQGRAFNPQQQFPVTWPPTRPSPAPTSTSSNATAPSPAPRSRPCAPPSPALAPLSKPTAATAPPPPACAPPPTASPPPAPTPRPTSASPP